MKLPIAVVLVGIALGQADAPNLLINGDARRGIEGWKTAGVAMTETIGGVPCFSVRAKGGFQQEIALPPNASGMFAALVGRGQSERLNADNSITGLPYLYGMVLTADRHRFLAYWQGQQMLARPSRPDEWVKMSGVFVIPANAAFISVQLQQAERRDSPQDGSAARFADVRLRLFSNEADARAFVQEYK